MDTVQTQKNSEKRTEMSMNSIENQSSYHLQFKKGQSSENRHNQNTNQSGEATTAEAEKEVVKRSEAKVDKAKEEEVEKHKAKANEAKEEEVMESGEKEHDITECEMKHEDTKTEQAKQTTLEMLVRQSYPQKIKNSHLYASVARQSEQEVLRVITTQGTVVKHMMDGSTQVCLVQFIESSLHL